MADNDWNAPDCDDQLPVISGIGHDSTREVIVHSTVGERSIDGLPIHSTIGRGPAGPQGEHGGELSETELNAMMDARIVLVPYAEWPPADPDDNVLYLRAAE